MESNVCERCGQRSLYKIAGQWRCENCDGLQEWIVDDVIIEDNILIRYVGKDETFEIPDSITSIGRRAFSGNAYLKSVTIPNSVTSIGDGAFEHCWQLQKVVVPSSVVFIGEYAFNSCPKLKKIQISKNNTAYKVNDNVLYTKDGKKLIKYLPTKKEKDFIVPNGVTSISGYAFYGCERLKNVALPSSMTSIGDRAFAWCYGLQNIMIPNSVTSIGVDAFAECCDLKSITIPNSVQSIGKFAFYYAGLTSIVIPNGVISIGANAFEGCRLKRIELPASVAHIGEWELGNCGDLAEIIVSDENTAYKAIDNVLYTKDGTKLIKYAPKKKGTSFVIPEGVKSIEKGAFCFCDKLKKVTISEEVASIGRCAFDRCRKLESIVISDSVTNVGEGAISDCAEVIIYVEAKEKPEGWHEDWSSNCWGWKEESVVWGYKKKK